MKKVSKNQEIKEKKVSQEYLIELANFLYGLYIADKAKKSKEPKS